MIKCLRLATRWFAITNLSVLLTACYALAGLDMSVEGRHKLWVEDMESQVGKGNMYECRYWICLDRKEKIFLGDVSLPNGNLEAGFIWWHTQPRCRYYYEYDPKSGVIVGFRFEETERYACRISGA
jgi:hypothetical protein